MWNRVSIMSEEAITQGAPLELGVLESIAVGEMD
jgi:hypothetical protein